MSWPESGTGVQEFSQCADGVSLSQRERARVRENSNHSPERYMISKDGIIHTDEREFEFAIRGGLKIFWLRMEHGKNTDELARGLGFQQQKTPPV